MLLQLPLDILGPILRLKLGEYSMSIASLRQTCTQLHRICQNFPKFIGAHRLDGCSIEAIQAVLSSRIVAPELDGWHWRGLYHNAVRAKLEDDVIYLVQIYKHNFKYFRCGCLRSSPGHVQYTSELNELTLVLDEMPREKAIKFMEESLPCPCLYEDIAEAALASNKLWLFEVMRPAEEFFKANLSFGLSVARSPCVDALNLCWFDTTNTIKNGKIYVAAARVGNTLMAEAVLARSNRITLGARIDAYESSILWRHDETARSVLNHLLPVVHDYDIAMEKLFRIAIKSGNRASFMDVYHKFSAHLQNRTPPEIILSLVNTIPYYSSVCARALLINEDNFIFFYTALRNTALCSTVPNAALSEYTKLESIALYLSALTEYNIPSDALNVLLRYIQNSPDAESILQDMLMTMARRSSSVDNIHAVLDMQCQVLQAKSSGTCVPEEKVKAMLLACATVEAFTLVKSRFASTFPANLSEDEQLLLGGNCSIALTNWISKGGHITNLLYRLELVNRSDETTLVMIITHIHGFPEQYKQEIVRSLLMNSRLLCLKALFAKGFVPDSNTFRAMSSYVDHNSIFPQCRRQRATVNENTSRMISWLTAQLKNCKENNAYM